MTWTIDPAHASIEFTGKHMMITTVRGYFEKFDVAVDLDTEDLTRSSVAATIYAASLETRNERRNNHLKSADFLDVARYPTITFTSTNIERVKENESRYTVQGNLTICGVTKPVELDALFEGIQTSPWGTQVAGFAARATISRKEWGLNWNLALETGGVMVSDRIDISIELELVKQGQEGAPFPVAASTATA